MSDINLFAIKEAAISKAEKLLVSSPQMSEAILIQLLRCFPEDPDALQLLALHRHHLNKCVEAIEIDQRAMELVPDNPDNYNNIALSLSAMGKLQLAVDHIKKAIELKPGISVYLNNLALQYRHLGQYDLAIETMLKALEIDNHAQMWANLGGIYGEKRDMVNSLIALNTAVKVDPECAAAHVDRAYVNLLLGKWQEGFTEYEWRFKFFPQLNIYKRTYDQSKKWKGESLVDKKILIYGEQGVGDLIQFVRYTKQLKLLGAHVTVHCVPALDSLVSRCEGVDATLVRDIINSVGEDFPEYDYQCSMISLPFLLNDFNINGKPYIEPLIKMDVRKKYPDTFNVGIVWAGNPAHPNDGNRSTYLKHFRKLMLPGVRFFNLQIDRRLRKYPNVDDFVDLTEGASDIPMIDTTDMIKTFEDTLTIISGLDLVITVDTAILHLAGAAGLPCWVLLPFNSDWRWGLSDERTVWYDSVTLFRQSKLGDWEELFDRVRSRLNESLLSH